VAKFDVGETVICEVTIKDADGTLTTPDTSTEIIITNPSGTVVTSANQAMTASSTGELYFDYDSASASRGKYSVTYTAVDGGRTTIQKDEFELE